MLICNKNYGLFQELKFKELRAESRGGRWLRLRSATKLRLRLRYLVKVQ